MQPAQDRPIVVAGGTGNVGTFIVQGLLTRGSTVVVPSRSERKLSELRTYLATRMDETSLHRLKTLAGDLGDETGAHKLLRQIANEVGLPGAVVATLGRWHSAPSLLTATTADLDHVLQGYLLAHHQVARTFLPLLKTEGGIYLFINGPLAFTPWGPETALVSISTAAQHMLFRALAKELEGTPVHVAELVSYAFIRDRQTLPGSPIPGEAIGAFTSHLLSPSAGDVHGRSIHLRSSEQLEEVGLDVSADDLSPLPQD